MFEFFGYNISSASIFIIIGWIFTSGILYAKIHFNDKRLDQLVDTDKSLLESFLTLTSELSTLRSEVGEIRGELKRMNGKS